MQAFLIISGFLTRVQSDRKFYAGIIRNLIIPMLIISALNETWDFCLLVRHGIYSVKDYICGILGILWGNHKSLGPCWFIYTLIIIRIINHYSNKTIRILFCVSCLILLTVYHEKNLSYSNAIINTLVCYPIFCIGILLQRIGPLIKKDIPNFKLALVMLLCMGIVYLCSKYNSVPWMWQNQYGNNLPVFLVGSVAGTGCIFCVSKLFEYKFNNFIAMLADGNIIVLGFHFTVIRYLFSYNLHYYYYIIALIVLLLFYPLIIFLNRHMPIMLGTRTQNR